MMKQDKMDSQPYAQKWTAKVKLENIKKSYLKLEILKITIHKTQRMYNCNYKNSNYN